MQRNAFRVFAIFAALAAFTCFAGPRVVAQRAQQQTQQQDGAKTYLGRTFDEWRAISLNDLDQATRDQAFAAFQAFARQPEYADAVLQATVASIDAGNSPHGGFVLLMKAGASAIPDLKRYMHSDKAQLRLHAVNAMRWLDGTEPVITTEGYTYGRYAPEADMIDLLIDIAEHDAESGVRAEACLTLAEFAQRMEAEFDVAKGAYFPKVAGAAPGPQSKKIMATLFQLTSDESQVVADMAWVGLFKQGVAAQEYLPQLIERAEALAEVDAKRRTDAQQPTGFGARGARNVPPQTAAQKPDDPNHPEKPLASSEERREMWMAFTALGPAAKDALPVLQRMLASSRNSRGSATASTARIQKAIDAIDGNAAQNKN